MFYSIIIPIYNEVLELPKLLEEIEEYYHEGHQIILINDGSDDGSHEILTKNSFINTIHFEKNQGKGIAVKKGLSVAKNDKIIIFDGDREINPSQIKKLMILDQKHSINCAFASRYQLEFPINSFWDLGNLTFTFLFNFFHNSSVTDALCCAKSFYKNDIKANKLISKKFDIDVEITSQLIKQKKNMKNVFVKYKRRYKREGKKLELRDSLRILYRILINI